MDREAAEQLGRNLWRARRRAGYSQQALGVMCSLHRTEIGLPKRLPRVDTLMKPADALEVRVESLLEGIEWMPAGPAAGGGFVVQRGG
ncbi:MAG TPA: helix-turn-helix transcriptional regulator [Solirubrobacterales bacterium]|nr:helix-turn-helix transcriptional regulator [Solirubrobacterales bacterium]